MNCKSVCQAAVMNCLLLKANGQLWTTYRVSTTRLAQSVICDVESVRLFSKQRFKQVDDLRLRPCLDVASHRSAAEAW